MLNDDDEAPQVTLDTSEGSISLSELRGRKLVLYFYPRDDTPGCTREAKDFGELAPAFADVGTRIIGVSKDSPASHARFAGKYAIPFALASDGDGRFARRSAPGSRRACTAANIWASTGRPS